MVHFVKVISLGQDDVDVKQPYSKEKGWGLTAAAKVLNCLCLKSSDHIWGLQKVQALFSNVCIPSCTSPFIFFCLFRKIPYFKDPSETRWRCFALMFLPGGWGFPLLPTLSYPDSDLVCV